MIIPNQMVQISINSKNKKYYEKLLNKTLKIAHDPCIKFSGDTFITSAILRVLFNNFS